VSGSAPPPPRGARSAPTPVRCAARGFVAFLLVAGVGQGIGFAEWLALHRPFGPQLPVKVGWLYFLAFHRVGIDLQGPAFFPASGTTNPPAVRVHLAFLTGTALAIVVMFFVGRRGAAGNAMTRVGSGAAAAVGYAAPALFGSLPVSLFFPSAGVSIRPVIWESAVMPFVIAVLPAVLGSLWSLRIDTPSAWQAAIRVSLVGGLRMFVSAIALAVIGLVLLAGLRPDGAGAYWRGVIASGPARAGIILTHQALLLPNQSLLVLTPEMGACDVASSSAGSTDLLCFGRQPIARTVADIGLAGGVPPHDDRMPAAFFVLVAVPLAAVLWGGALAGRAVPRERRWLVGAASGVVFGMLFTVGALLATISVSAPGSTIVRGTTSVGPQLPTAALVALAWGVVGGTIGTMLSGVGRLGEAAQDGMGPDD
jgi:hypothetical protein